MDKLKHHTLQLLAALGVLLILWMSFGGRGDAEMAHISAADSDAYAEEEVPLPPVAPAPKATSSAAANADTTLAATLPLAHSEILAMLSPTDTIRARNRYEAHFDSMPPGGMRMKINYLGGALGRVFNDSNYLHISSAEHIGVKPVSGLKSAWNAGASLERVQTCKEYYLDNLTHSLPFLVPEAHKLLTDIGAAFRDSLRARGGGDYRIKVTSVLRTPRLVRRLRRRNRNAVDTSAHLYGTTFDISYAKFICDSTTTPRTQEDMKNLLAEVVFAMREQGRCYVKYERKQACFHITAR